MSTWAGRSVFVTGHTGFQGSWLTLLLQRLGAKVHGYSLAPPTQPSLFDEAGLEPTLASHTIGDVRDLDALRAAIRAARSNVVLHLAAQPLVRLSYDEPVSTFATNVLGTVNLLEGLRGCEDVQACLVYTSDKCYENREWPFAYRESDALGGHDPYSASKGAAEIVTSSFARSFFAKGPLVATVRAGNVIGGGDWARERLIPDAVRAFSEHRPLVLRSPDSIRPWQHVLDPLYACLSIAELQLQGDTRATGPFNIGPAAPDHRSVRDVARSMAGHWPGAQVINGPAGGLHEANLLRLDTSRASGVLGWAPILNFEDAVRITTDWYYARASSKSSFDARKRMLSDIQIFEQRRLTR